MRLVLRLNYLSVTELAKVVLCRSRALNWDVHESVLPMIAQRAKGTPRLALRLLQSCRRVCRAEGDTTISPMHLETACELDQIDGLGLDATEQAYLRILVSGPARLNVIASRLGLPAATVQKVTEATLVRLDLVGKDKSGMRELTARGREHLSNSYREMGLICRLLWSVCCPGIGGLAAFSCLFCALFPSSNRQGIVL